MKTKFLEHTFIISIHLISYQVNNYRTNRFHSISSKIIAFIRKMMWAGKKGLHPQYPKTLKTLLFIQSVESKKVTLDFKGQLGLTESLRANRIHI